jgi:trigger factor
MTPTTITETGPFERLVTFSLTEDQINAAKKQAARKLAQEVKIHGFRPGKAPLPIVEATLGADRVRREAIDDLVPPVLTDVLDAEDIQPAVTPELESLDDDPDGGVKVGVRVTLWPKIELPPYKDRRVEVSSPLVSDDDLDTQLTRMREQFSVVEEVDRAARTGDFVSIDLEASIDGEPVEDAKFADLLYEVGSGMLLEGIDDELTMLGAGDTFTFEAPLPEGFGDLAGTRATFDVKVNEVKERVLPELTDDWVDDNTEFETVDELVGALRDRLGDAKLRSTTREFADRALATLRDQVEVEIPEGLLRAEMDNHLHNFLHRLEQAEVNLEDYFSATGITREVFLDDLRNQADMALRNRLVLEAVALAEDIDVTEEDLSKAVQALAARSEDPVAYLKAFAESGQGLALASDILRNRALDVILTNATPVDEDGETVDLKLNVEDAQPEVQAEVLDGDDNDLDYGEVVAEIVEEEE